MRITKETHAPAQSTIFPPETTAPVIEQGAETITSLAVIETTSAALIYAPGALTALTDKIKAEVRGQLSALNVSIPKHRERIITLAARVASAKVKLDEAGKTLTEDHRKVIDGVNADRKAMRDDLDAFKIEVRKPVTDLENAEKERVAKHEAALAEIELSGPHSLQNWMTFTREAMHDRLREIESDPRDWQEFSTRAAQTKAYAKAQIMQAIDAKERYESAQKELERLRSEAAERAIKEREEAAALAAKEAAERKAEEQARIAREAAEAEQRRIENERIQAEARAKQAEAERLAAEQRAARELQEAEERRKREAEQAEARRIADAEAAKRREEEAAAKAKRDQEAAIEAERQRVAAAQRRELEEAEKRAKNRAHLASVNREVLADLVALGASEEFGKVLIEGIVKGGVRHTTIAY